MGKIEAGRAVSDAEWQAFAARQPTGLVWAVTTTGIHCRDFCPGRPLRANLRILASRTAAETGLDERPTELDPE